MLVSGICVRRSWITGTEGRRSMWRFLIRWATTSLKWSCRIMSCTVVSWRTGKSTFQLNVSSLMQLYILLLLAHILLWKTVQATGSWVKQQVIGASWSWIQQQVPCNCDAGCRSCDLQLNLSKKIFVRFCEAGIEHLQEEFSIGKFMEIGPGGDSQVFRCCRTNRKAVSE